MATSGARVEALEIAFVALTKFLGKNLVIPVTQVPGVMESEAKASTSNEEVLAAVATLAKKVRGR